MIPLGMTSCVCCCPLIGFDMRSGGSVQDGTALTALTLGLQEPILRMLHFAGCLYSWLSVACLNHHSPGQVDCIDMLTVVGAC